MKKFNFHLEGLLTLRDWEEQKARQALGEISSEITGLRANIAELERMKEQMFERWNAECGGTFSPQLRISMEAENTQMKQRELRLRGEIRKAEARKAEAIGELKKRARAKQVVENLKERRLEEFRSEFYRQEALEIEDIFNSRHKGV
ncbi:MAG: hypothetical protein AAGB46_06940 [Verrucomicrobiota bacterium]